MFEHLLLHQLRICSFSCDVYASGGYDAGAINDGGDGDDEDDDNSY